MSSTKVGTCAGLPEGLKVKLVASSEDEEGPQCYFGRPTEEEDTKILLPSILTAPICIARVQSHDL